jgi:hypothetical protein
MYFSAQVTEIDYVWKKWTQEYWVFFFIVFIIVGSFFLINLFVGVVISSFNRERDSIGGNILLTDRQKEWIETHTKVLKAKPLKKFRVPENKVRATCYKITENVYFQNFVSIIVLFNIIAYTLKWQGQAYDFAWKIQYFIDSCTLVYLFEFLIKVTGYGRVYFKNHWNIIDFVALLGQICSVCFTLNFHFNEPPPSQVLGLL